MYKLCVSLHLVTDHSSCGEGIRSEEHGNGVVTVTGVISSEHHLEYKQEIQAGYYSV